MSDEVVKNVVVEADRLKYTVSYTQQVKQFHPLHVGLEFESSVKDGETPEEALARIEGVLDPVFVRKVREALEEVEDVITNG